MAKVRLDIGREAKFSDGSRFMADRHRHVDLPPDKARLVRQMNLGAPAGVSFSDDTDPHACKGVVCGACGFHAFWPGTCPKCGSEIAGVE